MGGQSPIDWNSFSTQFASWLLPWLTLTAQLPFETRSGSTNGQSLLLAIGSLFLIIYSLALTILNARSINKIFRKLLEKNNDLKIPKHAKDTNAERISSIRLIMIEGQSVPLQIYNGPDREFAQLVVNPENVTWFTGVVKEILKTKR